MALSHESPAMRPSYGIYNWEYFVILLAAIIVGVLLAGVGVSQRWALLTYCSVGIVLLGIYMLVAAVLDLSGLFGRSFPSLVEKIVRLTGMRGDEHVLDVGCGLGKATLQLAKHLTTGRITGIDIYDKRIVWGNSRERAERNAIAEGVADRAVFMEGNALDLPFHDDSFDVATAFMLVHELQGEEMRRRSMAELYRVLKPNGRLILAEFLRDGRNFLVYVVGVFHFLSRQYWERTIQQTGFKKNTYARFGGMAVFIAEKSTFPPCSPERRV